MDTLEELVYYCNESQPVGALLLTGEWGCGKTYLVENELKKKLEDSHVFLHVSLFGMESVEEIKDEVKRCWLFAESGFDKKGSNILEKLKQPMYSLKKFAKEKAEVLPTPWKYVVGGALSVSMNVMDFIEIKPEIGTDKRKVVLVFDDLERSNISTGDLLGCMNDYCENLHINTIIIANEEKIKSNDSDKIAYEEIKEKIIQRTIHYAPDFSTIVSNVIDDLHVGSLEYKSFLKANTEAIEAIFSAPSIDNASISKFISKKYPGYSGEERESLELGILENLKKRPHNIRSLKCALQDFGRIFEKLIEKNIKNRERWLLMYVSYVLAFRAGLAKEGEYGTLFSDEKISLLYPGFYNENYFTKSIKKWIRYGEWNGECLEAELDWIMEREKAIVPEEKVRLNRFYDLEENDFKIGYPLFLKKAYGGEIELNDYVNMIENLCWAEKYKLQLPTTVDWTKIYNGINSKIQELVQRGEEYSDYRKDISVEKLKDLLPAGLKAYEMISTFLDNNTLEFNRNKKIYLDLVRTEPVNVLNKTRNLRYSNFDDEMAAATAEGFSNINNEERNSFVDDFKEMWEGNLEQKDHGAESSESGFQKLKELLEKFKDRCHKESLQIAEVHTNRFIEVVEQLIEEEWKLGEENKSL